MNLDELEELLPWGFHDAYLERMAIDWIGRRMTLDLRVMMTEHQDKDQRARVTIKGLVFCSIDPPVIDPARGYEPCASTGLWINTGSGAANDDAKIRLPPTPDGCFLHWFFVHGWNSFIHLCGHDAELSWIEADPLASRAATRALFPGDEIPDPDDGERSSGDERAMTVPSPGTNER